MGPGPTYGLVNIYKNYSYNHGVMTQDRSRHPYHTDNDEKTTPRRSQGHVSAGFWHIIGVGSTTSTATCYVIKKSDKLALSKTGCLFRWYPVSLNANLIAQQMMCGLCWVQRIVQSFDFGRSMGTGGWKYRHLVAVRWSFLQAKTKSRDRLQNVFNTSLTFVCRPLAPRNVR